MPWLASANNRTCRLSSAACDASPHEGSATAHSMPVHVLARPHATPHGLHVVHTTLPCATPHDRSRRLPLTGFGASPHEGSVTAHTMPVHVVARPHATHMALTSCTTLCHATGPFASSPSGHRIRLLRPHTSPRPAPHATTGAPGDWTVRSAFNRPAPGGRRLCGTVG